MSSGIGEPFLLVIAGPTASGKTALAIELAQYFQTEIISADSRQVFKGMPIGTAQPTKEELELVKHHCIAHKSPNEDYNAGQFAEEATNIVKELNKKHKIMVICGGSGLYLQALLYGFDEMPTIPSSYREKWEKFYHEQGLLALFHQLEKMDPTYANKVDHQNPQRILRALEVCDFTQKKYSDFRKKEVAQPRYKHLFVVLNPDREILYQNINHRVENMMQQGLLEEVKSLLEYRYFNALQTVGYTEIFDYLDGNIHLEQSVALIQQHTRNFAKRQVTWFKKVPQAVFLDKEDKAKILALVEEQLRTN